MALMIINKRKLYLKLCPLGVTCLLCRESLVTVTASISSSSGRARATRSGSVMISLYASSHSTDPARDSLESEEGVAAADTNCLQGDTGSSLIDGSWKLQLKSKSWKYGDSNLQRDSFIRINLNISIIIVFSGCGEGFITSRVHAGVSSELLSERFLLLCCAVSCSCYIVKILLYKLYSITHIHQVYSTDISEYWIMKWIWFSEFILSNSDKLSMNKSGKTGDAIYEVGKG